MKKSIILMLLFCLLVTASYTLNQKEDVLKPAQSIEELQQQLEKILIDTDTPGLSIAIVHRDGSKWVAGLGKADVIANRAVTQETLFRIASISKTFISLSILNLVNEGKLSLEDPVHKLVPEVWFENPWEESDPVRVVDLLEHTTGWDDIFLREYAKDAPPNMSLRDQLDYDHHSRISRWQPGTRMAYGNSGPAVAAYIVEKITGQRFEDYVLLNFFKPIGMKTATYFQPVSAPLTMLYHSDAKTPVPYWNCLFRPSMSLNVSANDMATYILFYLNRGAVNGTQVVPAALIDRMELPTRTWAAKDGLEVGYGLSNYGGVRDGFVYHGHTGSIEGCLSTMFYLPDYGVGYFCSINTVHGEALKKISNVIRAYITRGLDKPVLPPLALLPANAFTYAGWYQLDAPRLELFHIMERLLGITLVRFEDDKLLISNLIEGNQVFVPVTGRKFRLVPNDGVPDPVATVELIPYNAEGQFIQTGWLTMKHIPAWYAVTEIFLVGWFVLAVISVLIYAPFWILGGFSKKWCRPTECAMLIWPFIAVLNLLLCIVLIALGYDDGNSRFGHLTFWSGGLFLGSIVYAITSVTSALTLWRAPKQEVRKSVRKYSIAVTMALLIATVYLAYWGVIGFRTWV